jgi:hypothetical protein
LLTGIPIIRTTCVTHFSETPNKSSAFKNSTGCGVFACRAGMAVALLVMRPDGLNKGGLEEKSAWLG